MWTSRSILSWILITLSAIIFVIAVNYSKNTVLLIFGKGELRFNDPQKMMQIIDENYHIYKKSDTGNEKFSYVTTDNITVVSVLINGNNITEISGKIHIENLNLGDLINFKKTIDQSFVPVINRSDIMPMEILIVIQMLSIPEIISDYSLEKIIGDVKINIFFDIDEKTVNFELRPYCAEFEIF